jgi:hypothetical protein
MSHEAVTESEARRHASKSDRNETHPPFKSCNPRQPVDDGATDGDGDRSPSDRDDN